MLASISLHAAARLALAPPHFLLACTTRSNQEESPMKIRLLCALRDGVPVRRAAWRGRAAEISRARGARGAAVCRRQRGRHAGAALRAAHGGELGAAGGGGQPHRRQRHHRHGIDRARGARRLHDRHGQYRDARGQSGPLPQDFLRLAARFRAGFADGDDRQLPGRASVVSRRNRCKNWWRSRKSVPAS